MTRRPPWTPPPTRAERVAASQQQRQQLRAELQRRRDRGLQARHARKLQRNEGTPMSEQHPTAEQMAELTSAIRSIAHGPTSGPTGLEMLAMAIGGEHVGQPLSQAIRDGHSEVARAIETGLVAIAEAIADNTHEGEPK